jgi:peptidoglycan/LPS O-acetylase OafA/YrhL
MAHDNPRLVQDRLPSGDGLRAVAAGLVFLHHASFLTGTTTSSRAGTFFARFDIGVAVFFALSGLLLTRPYAAALLDGDRLPDWRRFYRRRFVRIVPAYWVALTATYLWLRPESATTASGVDRVLHYLFLQIYPANTFQKGISPAWTLAVEMSFYASLPWLAVLGRRLVARRATVNQRALVLLGGIAGLYALSLGWRGLVFATGMPAQAALWLPGTIDQFAIGMAAAVLAVWASRRAVARPVAEALGRHDLRWWVLAALLLCFTSTQLGLATGLEHAAWDREMLRQGAYGVFAGLLLLPVAFGPQDRGLVRAALRSWPLRSMGVVSYGFFLWHVPLIETAINRSGRHPFLDWSGGVGVIRRDVLVPTALAFGLAILAASASWFLVEKPLLRRQRQRDRRPVLEQAAP